MLCDALWQAAEKVAKTGGETFAATVRAAYDVAGWPAPAVGAFAVGASGAGPLPQGLRCLGGRILANAAALRACVEQGLAQAAVQPLLARIARDVAAAETWPAEAGLVEY